MKGIDKRTVKRRHIIYYLEVSDPESGETLGHLVDITTSGMMIISEKPFDVDQERKLRVACPPSISLDPFIDIQGKSIWCHKDVNPSYYAVGLKFFDMSPDQADRIVELIDQLGFMD